MLRQLKLTLKMKQLRLILKQMRAKARLLRQKPILALSLRLKLRQQPLLKLK